MANHVRCSMRCWSTQQEATNFYSQLAKMYWRDEVRQKFDCWFRCQVWWVISELSCTSFSKQVLGLWTKTRFEEAQDLHLLTFRRMLTNKLNSYLTPHLNWHSRNMTWESLLLNNETRPTERNAHSTMQENFSTSQRNTASYPPWFALFTRQRFFN